MSQLGLEAYMIKLVKL